MGNDMILNKVSTIRRCVVRIHEEYAGLPDNLLNITKQDSIILNIQRACKASIDLAMYVISERGLGLPQHSKDAFDLLHLAGAIDESLNARLKAMVGFRNVAIHNYQAVQVKIVQGIIADHLVDFEVFIECILDYMK